MELELALELEPELEVVDEEDRVQIRRAPGSEGCEGSEEGMPGHEKGLPISRRVVAEPEEGQRLSDVRAMWRTLE
jgi:hypothetical protein